MLEKRKQAISRMFDEIAGIYDLGNHLLSLGQDFFWRKRVAGELALSGLELILDMASGTGDMGVTIAKKNPDAQIFAIDFAMKMLALGSKKIEKKGLSGRIFFAGADIEEMPFPEQSFDAATIAFGVRNFENREKGLEEIFRVLKPGGILAVLEFSLPDKGWFAGIYRFYLCKVLPRIGRIIGGQSAYFYLRDSILDFPSPELFAEELKASGFLLKKIIPLSGSTVQLYLAEKKN